MKHGKWNGWPLVGWFATVVTVLVLVAFAVSGGGAEGFRAVIRLTARTSVMLFLAAFTASAVQRRWPSPVSRWVLRNRRYLGVSFAFSHAIHLLAIVWLASISAEFRNAIETGTIVGGGLAYVFIALMTATSFDRTAALLGRRAWGTLHTVGAYYIWFIFVMSYVPRALASIAYAPIAVVLLAAFGLRIMARRRQVAPAVAMSA